MERARERWRDEIERHPQTREHSRERSDEIERHPQTRERSSSLSTQRDTTGKLYL
jgi:hypothetical protein